MSRHLTALLVAFASLTLTAVGGLTQAPSVKGTFVMNKSDAKLAHVRATKTVLDDGKKQSPGYAVLLSTKPAEAGDFSAWRMGDPHERGSFIYLMLESNGEVWIAELGHNARKGGKIGVVLEVKKVTFAVKDGRITGQYRTNREETFFDDRYTVDVTFDAPLEGK
jgi:hypothetical protein